MIATNTSDWWVQMSLIVAAFDGLVEGYNFAATNATQLTSLQLAILNAIGDFLDLIPVRSYSKPLPTHPPTYPPTHPSVHGSPAHGLMHRGLGASSDVCSLSLSHPTPLPVVWHGD